MMQYTVDRTLSVSSTSKPAFLTSYTHYFPRLSLRFLLSYGNSSYHPHIWTHISLLSSLSIGSLHLLGRNLSSRFLDDCCLSTITPLTWCNSNLVLMLPSELSLWQNQNLSWSKHLSCTSLSSCKDGWCKIPHEVF